MTVSETLPQLGAPLADAVSSWPPTSRPTTGAAGIDGPPREPTRSAAFDDRAELTSAVAESLVVPEVAFALVALGLVATAVWVAHPTLRWVAVSGVLVLCCGLVGLATMPPSPAALLFLALAMGNLAMEVLALPGFALHAFGGALGLALAGLCLSEPWSGAHPSVVLPGAALVGVGTWWAARRSWRARRIDPLDMSDRLLGRDLVILDAGAGNLGHAVVAGHLWTIHDPNRPLVQGGAAQVTGRSDELLTVRQRRTGARSPS